MVNATSTDFIRTAALVGHAGAGKTMLAEALLHAAGVIPVCGSIEKGSTVCDFDPLARQYLHSLNSAVVGWTHKDIRVHLIDTPGYPDFAGPAISALAAVETALVVVNAQTGIELTTERMMRWAAQRGLCRMIIINKIDSEDADLPGVVASIQEAFGKECLPINLPAEGAKRVVDCFFNPSGEADFSSVEDAHSKLVDQVVEVDEELMERYLASGTVSPEELHGPFEKALREGHLVPILFCSARDGAGVAELLEVIERLAPNPREGNPPLFLKGEGPEAKEFSSVPGPEQHVLAHVFKVAIDPYVGKVGVFRVHQGTVRRDSQLYIGDARRAFKVGHLFMLQGKDYREVNALVPGDIGAVSKVDDIDFDSVLHDSHEEDHIHLRPLEFPEPMHGLSVEPRKKGDEQRLFETLAKLSAEDPCFRSERRPATNETVIRGLGDLHMRCTVERMAKMYKLEITTKLPTTPYRETITRSALGHCRHKKQSGGAGQFGEVYLRVEPRERGAGFEFADEVKGGVIPNVYIPAVEKGVRQALAQGVIAGYPVHDLRVIVYDGKSHPVDSKEIAFSSAGRKAVIDAVAKAGPILLEPIVGIEITAPSENIGDLTADLAGRRGHITGTQVRSGDQAGIIGQAPLVELSDYQTHLKSITAGRGSYSIEFSHYAPVPAPTQQKLVSQHRTVEEED
jgi:elongation factor G